MKGDPHYPNEHLAVLSTGEHSVWTYSESTRIRSTLVDVRTYDAFSCVTLHDTENELLLEMSNEEAEALAEALTKTVSSNRENSKWYDKLGSFARKEEL